MLHFYNKSLFACSFMIIFHKIVIENEISMTVSKKIIIEISTSLIIFLKIVVEDGLSMTVS